MSDEQRNTKPVDDNYQADLDDVGFWLRVALLQPPQMSYGGVSVKTIPTEQIKAMLRTLDQQATLEAERDAARAEAERLRAACSRKEDVYPTETVITRSASDLLVEFSQFAFFLGDIRKSKEASYRAQYIRAALESEADHE